jgi:hypothetical protein
MRHYTSSLSDLTAAFSDPVTPCALGANTTGRLKPRGFVVLCLIEFATCVNWRFDQIFVLFDRFARFFQPWRAIFKPAAIMCSRLRL